jgi:hypothetical protein
MIRTIAFLVCVWLVQPTMAQQDALNPFKIVLGNSTIAALKSNPKGLVWPFETLGTNVHDGVTVYFDPSEAMVTTWKVNDGTMQNLFSLDVTDEILQQIEDDYGLPALISPSDRERIRGVLLRYVPPAGGALPPSSAIGPIGGSAASNVSGTGTLPQAGSVLDSNRVSSNLDLAGQNLRPLGNAASGGALNLGGANDFYQNRPAPLQPQASEFGANRPAFGGSANGSGVASATGDRFASNQPLLPPPNYNSNAMAAGGNPNASGVGANASGVGGGGFLPQARPNWPAAETEQWLPNRRPAPAQFPQVSYNPYADNQQGPLAGQQVTLPAGVTQLPTGGVGGGDAALASGNWQAERQTLVSDLAESKQRSVFLLFMLFLLTGLCLYLSWLARGFYFRYAELADELRETFSATS